jgi:MFS family permease
MSLGPLVGPPLGGVLFDAGARWPFAVAGGWVVVLLIGLLLVLPQGQYVAARRRTDSRFAVWRYYVGPAVVAAIGATFLGALDPTLPLYLEGRLGTPPSIIGILFGLAALSYGLFSPLAGWAADRFGTRRTMAGGLLACVVTLPLITLPGHVGGEAVALAAFGASCSFLLTPTLPEFAAICERHGLGSLGSAYSLFNTAYAVGMVVGPILAGCATSHLGLPLTLTVFALAALAYFPILARRGDPQTKHVSRPTRRAA